MASPTGPFISYPVSCLHPQVGGAHDAMQCLLLLRGLVTISYCYLDSDKGLALDKTGLYSTMFLRFWMTAHMDTQN